MITREQFFGNYDYYMPQYCEPYHSFLSLGASVIPRDIQSICDAGIGTGNFSAAVKRRIPAVKIYGIDHDKESLQSCAAKIPDAVLYTRDIFAEPLPQAEYVISSLALHHLDTDSRREKLTSLVKNAKGFVNFDMMLIDGNTFDDSIRLILDFAAQHFHDRQDLQTIEQEMRLHDNPMPLEEQRELFTSLGLEFRVLAVQAPYAVYHAFRSAKNS